MGLVLLLMQFQIDAACRLHERLDQWWLSDAALKRLRFSQLFRGSEFRVLFQSRKPKITASLEFFVFRGNADMAHKVTLI
jgi:hypothetical protein